MTLKVDKSNWKKTKLDDVIEWYQKDIPNGEQAAFEIKNFVTAEHIDSDAIKIKRTGKIIDGKKGPTITKHFQEGDLLLSTRSVALRKAAIAQNEGVTGEKILVLRPRVDSMVLKNLFSFVFHSSDFWNFAQNTAAGSVNKFTSWTKLRKYKFLLPPRDQQAEIAELLWAMDDNIEKEIELLKSLRILIKATRKKHFQTKQGDSYSLGNLAEIRAGIGFPLKYQGRLNNEIMFFKVGDMNSEKNRRYMNDSNNTITKTELKKLKGKIHKKGTLIFPKVGAAIATEKKRILSVDAVVDNNIMGVTPFDESVIQPDYLLEFFKTISLTSISNAGVVPSLNAQIVKNIKIYLPLEEIVKNYLVKINAMIELLEKTYEKINRSKTLKKSIINEIFSS